MSRATLLPALLALATATTSLVTPASAQTPKETILDDLTRDRANVLAYARAMPDSALAFHPTSGVRNFAQQIDHIVSTNVEVAASILRHTKTNPVVADTAKLVHDKAALAKYVGDSYDYVIAAVKDAKPADLARDDVIFGAPKQPVWRILDLAHEHSVWTLGQIVPYLRLNGATPPEYSIPF
jgi:hypothetical protein